MLWRSWSNDKSWQTTVVTGGSLWEVLLEIRKSETPLRTVEDNGERLDYMDIAKIMPQDSLSPRNKNNSPIISAIILL